MKQSTDMVQRLFDIIEKLTPSTFGKCHSVLFTVEVKHQIKQK